MRLWDKAEMVFGLHLLLSAFATIGGWWALFLKDYTILNLILAITTVSALLMSLALAGPFIIWDIIRKYREEEE